MSRIRKTVLGIGVVAVVVVVVHLAFAAFAARRLAGARERFETAVGSLAVEDYAPQAPDEVENAAHWLSVGTRALVVLSGPQAAAEELLLERLKPDLTVVLTTEERAVADGLVSRNRPALELLGKAASCPRSSFGIDYADGADAALPPLIDLVETGRVVGLEGRLAVEARDRGRLVRSLGTLSALGRSLENEPILVANLVAMAVDPIYRQLLGLTLSTGMLDTALAAEVSRQLEARDPLTAFGKALAGEAAMASSVPAVVAAFGELEPTAVRRLEARVAQPGLDLMYAKLLDDYRELVALLGRPLPEIRRGWEDLEQRGSLLGHKSPLYVDLMQLTGKAKQAESGHALAVAAIDLWRAGTASGAGYPSSVEYWIDPFSGGGVSYELSADGSAELSARAADEAWVRLYGEAAQRTREVFTWRLPAPADEPASSI